MICYEQPVNELIRTCLRLEYLYKQAQHFLHSENNWDSRVAITTIIDILNVLDRPDLKSKLAKELSRHYTNFVRLSQHTEVDVGAISKLLAELQRLMDGFHQQSGKLGQELRSHGFLNTLRQRLNSPGGCADFDMPALALWLKQPAAARVSQLNQWLHSFDNVFAAINLLLRIIRQSNLPETKLASGGFFQMMLDAQLPCQLVRVSMPSDLQLYPEISVGRHGISIRFFEFAATPEPASQCLHDVSFRLTVGIL